MRWHVRRLHAAEPDHELIWLAVTLSAAGAMLTWLALQLPWPGCPFRALFGVPCLTCGATRAALAFVQGDLGGAWQFNPLATLALAGMALFDVYAVAVLVRGGRRLRVSLRRPLIVPLLCAAALLNWIYLLRQG